MSPREVSVIGGVPAADYPGHRNTPGQAVFQDVTVPAREALVAELQSTESIVDMWIDSRVVEHQIRLQFFEKAGKILREGVEVCLIFESVIEADVEVARELSKRKVLLRMHRKGKHRARVRHCSRGAVSLMDIEIDDEDPIDAPVVDESFRSDRKIVEDTEAGTKVRMCMVCSAGHVARNTMIQRQPRGKERSRYGRSRSLDERCTPGKPDPSQRFAVEATVEERVYIVERMHPGEELARGGSRGVHRAGLGDPVFHENLVDHLELRHWKPVPFGERARIQRVIN